MNYITQTLKFGDFVCVRAIIFSYKVKQGAIQKRA